jgi:hypothetical protein
MSAEEVLFEAEADMEKAVEFMMHEFATIRTGKASPALVENIDVTAYGSSMKLKQLALITSPEIRLLVIQPFDAGTVQDIQKAILESKVGITPAIDGKLIRLRIPELSEERRKDLVRTSTNSPRRPGSVSVPVAVKRWTVPRSSRRREKSPRMIWSAPRRRSRKSPIKAWLTSTSMSSTRMPN